MKKTILTIVVAVLTFSFVFASTEITSEKSLSLQQNEIKSQNMLKPGINHQDKVFSCTVSLECGGVTVTATGSTCEEAGAKAGAACDKIIAPATQYVEP
ncbi:MAG: hypothetical protein EO766_01155 [Hydrotalea sp. AMD]|jgi:hypothetical protein|uniref:hypothetical protein n=1 Tax=Hydrotalea sp. AMD TaxID=2501297 RepID=UPI00102557DB|nr:hypothetical protein [Hydrotalea sp. AMD]RWZ90796.1 MAG: hypothetical protein EO766_01155 [Hydrotalea sp. AMD]